MFTSMLYYRKWTKIAINLQYTPRTKHVVLPRWPTNPVAPVRKKFRTQQSFELYLLHSVPDKIKQMGGLHIISIRCVKFEHLILNSSPSMSLEKCDYCKNLNCNIFRRLYCKYVCTNIIFYIQIELVYLKLFINNRYDFTF